MFGYIADKHPYCAFLVVTKISIALCKSLLALAINIELSCISGDSILGIFSQCMGSLPKKTKGLNFKFCPTTKYVLAINIFLARLHVHCTCTITSIEKEEGRP